MTRQFTCPDDGRTYDLPDNLYPHQRKVAGKWRYKGPDGMKALTYYTGKINGELPTYIDVVTAIEAAEALNRKFNVPLKTELGKMQPGTIPSLIEMHIDNIERRDRFSCLQDKTSWTNEKYLLRDFGKAFWSIRGHELTKRMLRDWWYSEGEFINHPMITYHSQKNRRAGLEKFFNGCLIDGVVKLDSNPFKATKTGCEMGYRHIEPKQRLPLSIDWFMAIREEAEAAGEYFLLNALDLGLQTKLRRADMASLRFDTNISQQYFFSNISKSQHQMAALGRAAEGQVNIWDLSEAHNKPIIDVLQQCEETRGRVCRPRRNDTISPYVIHRRWRGAVPPTKDHFSQTLPDGLSKVFKQYRDKVSDIAKLPPKMRPTFHEIRALAGHLEMRQGKDLKTISVGFAHSDVKVTKSKYLNSHAGKLKLVNTTIDPITIKEELSRPTEFKPELAQEFIDATYG